LDYIVSSSYDGYSRKLYPKLCSCGNIFYVPRNRLSSRKHCSRACGHEARKRQLHLRCENCGELFTRTPSDLKASKSGLFFCSRICKDHAQSIGGVEAIRPDHYGKGNGAHDYRERALRHYGARCQSCGYDRDLRMLDVDHIDGSRANNDMSNLRVLCVWCHALKTRQVESHSCPGSVGMEPLDAVV
jgi:hypothetical protein